MSLLKRQLPIVALLVFGMSGAVRADDNTLYDELGGEQGVQTIVQQLLLVMSTNEVIKPHFKSINIAGFRSRLEAFICVTTGGPCTYNGRSMSEAHATLSIDRRVFNYLVADLITAMDVAEVGYAAQNGLLARLAAMEADIVSDKPFDRKAAAESRARSVSREVPPRVAKENK